MTLRTILACGASVVLYPLALHSVGALVAVALTPVLVVIVTLKKGRDLVLLSWAVGALAALLVQHTLWVASVAGTLVLSVYQGMLWVPMAFAVRYAHKRWRIPFALSWPVIWCAGEVLRGLGPLGTLFGTLAVPKTTTLWMLQIVDLGGASVAAFPLAALQGWFADLFLNLREQGGWGRRFRRRFWCWPVRMATAWLVLVWGFVGLYGSVRLSQVEERMQGGPWVGVVATDVLSLPGAEAAYDPALLLEKLQALSEAIVEEAPQTELIVWPEGLLGASIPNRAFLETPFEPRMASVIASETGLKESDPSLETCWDQMRASSAAREQAFQRWVETLGVSVLVGMDAWVPAPAGYGEPFLLQNAAVHFSPDSGQDLKAQAKVRLYPLGEYLPLGNSVLGPIVRFLLGEPRADYHAGSERHRYPVGDTGVEYAIALCSELKFDHLRGDESGSRGGTIPYKMLVNLANEGLFQRNGMPEIFAFCATLRAIENRVTVVRSSNSGISGFWGPTGKAYGMVRNDEGRVQSGLGAAELAAVEKVIRFRQRHQDELQTSPARHQELTSLVEEAELIRTAAAVEGCSAQPVYWLPGKTGFNSYGNVAKFGLVGVLILLNCLACFDSIRCGKSNHRSI